MAVISAHTDSLDFYQWHTVLLLQLEKQFLQLCPGLWAASSFEAMPVVFGDLFGFTTEMTCYYREGREVQKKGIAGYKNPGYSTVSGVWWNVNSSQHYS